MMHRLLFLLPIVAFAALAGFLAMRLVLMDRGNTPDLVPSALINKPAPIFDLPPLLADKPGFSSKNFKDQVTIINFFASWCVPCRAEHPLLMQLKDQGAELVGIAYKNKPEDAKAWLGEMGDPYDTLAADIEGRTAINFGLYGVPETYVIDKKGIIRFKQTGPLTPEVIHEQILPLLKELNK
jgi:DsbE subfamily thiol:disulfide oxidoreductase